METIAQILTKNKDIQEINYDFATYKKKYHTYFNNKVEEMQVRYNNLHTIIEILNKHNIEHWLQGKTMLGIAKYKKLLINDSDEDIGLDNKNIKKICNIVIPELLNLGFKVIRATKNNSMVSVMKDKRYLDFCFFSTYNEFYYYEKKIFPKIFFNKIIEITVNGYKYKVPKKYKEICKYSYNV
tara:strand:- start:1526 stop:2074 length:549 start_codon:yes stop_codon:yes gene_type:complete